jgi:hypothetical protein
VMPLFSVAGGDATEDAGFASAIGSMVTAFQQLSVEDAWIQRAAKRGQVALRLGRWPLRSSSGSILTIRQ